VDTSPPQIPRFRVEQLDDGRYRATAEYTLTPKMVAGGCQKTLHADDISRLAGLCYWERIRAAGLNGWRL
jgi:hypothetical protein